MTSVISYFLTFIGVIFWGFRGVVAAMETLEKPFVCTTLNLNVEIAILFLTLPCLLLVIRRSLIGASVYMGIYVTYFGTALYNLLRGLNGDQGLSIDSSIDLLCSVLGIIIPMLTFVDIMFNKHRKNLGLEKKTEWYYKNEKFDRVLDERADKNQYKIR